MKMPPSGYMVYVLIDPRDRLPFYVGITCRPTARWTAHNTDSCGSNAYPRLHDLRGLGLKCRVRIVAANLSVQEARDRERLLIAEHRATIANGQSSPARAA